MPTFAVEHQPHIEACMYARHQRDTKIYTKGDLSVLALVFGTTRRGELAITNGDRPGMVAGEEAIKLIDLIIALNLASME